MTKTLVGTPDDPPNGDFSWLSAYDNVPLVEELLPCSLQLRSSNNDGKLVDCPNASVEDAIVTCPEGHLRTQHYCKRCFDNATAGRVACRVCRSELDKPVAECLVSVLTTCSRSFGEDD